MPNVFFFCFQAIDQGLTLEPDSKAFDTEIQNYQFLEKQHSDIDTAFELKDYRKALFHVDQSLNIGVASKRLKVKKAECLAYLGKSKGDYQVNIKQ